MGQGLKILLADDEYYARKALAKKVLQADADAEIVDDFENGLQVLEYLEAHPNEIDVVLTDVKMPEMDGLHLAQYLFEQELGVEVIIISGYNEFEYAKKAISFGVSNYLVKPVQREELKEALEKIGRERRSYENRMQRIMEKRTMQFLSIEEIFANEKCRRSFLDPTFGRNEGKAFCIAVVQKTASGEMQDQTLERLLRKVKEQFLGELFYFNRFQEYVLLLFGGRQEMTAALENMVDHSAALKSGGVTAGISFEHGQAEQCTKAYQEAVYAINQRLIEGWNRVYVFSPDIRPENRLGKEKEGELEDAITDKRYGRAEEITRDILEQCRDAYTLYVTISSIFNLLYRFFCRTSSEGREGNHGYMLFSYRTDLYRFRTLEEVEDYVLCMVRAMCEEQEEKSYHHIVSEILAYIAQNYQNNISIGELAEHKFFMNSSYLSRLFKNEMGKTFSAYLMEYRMKKARELLESNLLKISDVAMLSGYNDVSRFIQYFKKTYGVTPEEYRGRR